MEGNRYTPHSFSKRFSPETLLRQFLVCKRLDQIPNKWRQESIDEFWIGIHPELPVSSIKFSHSNYTAYFLGYVIDPIKGTYNRPEINNDQSDEKDFSSIERYLHHLSGRFVCIVTNGTSTRIYLDASGSFSLAYSVKADIAASSTMLIPYGNEVDDNITLINQLQIPLKSNIYPFGLAPRKQLKRLLPNHYLDLKTWKATRHWPQSSFDIDDNTKALADEYGDLLEKTIDVVMQQDFHPYMSLTSGVDSRTLLACAKKWIEKITIFTWELPDPTAKLDTETAQSIANKHQLHHVIYPFEEANQLDQDTYAYRTGLSAGEVRGMSLTTTVNTMDHTQPLLTGNVSAVTCGVYQRPDEGTQPLTAKEVVTRIAAPLDPQILDAADEWLQGLSHLNPQEVSDMLYLEQRVGCWGSELANGHAGGPFQIYPYSNRRMFEIALSSNNEYHHRKDRKLLKAIIKQKWPELLEYEFG